MSMASGDIRFHPFVAAVYDPVQTYFEWRQAPPHRRYLARGLGGRVLEIGAGAMYPYYDSGADAELHGVEPDLRMRRQAERKLGDADVDMRLVEACAESLPYPSDTFDFVVECGVLCSATDVDAAFREVGRVLKPGGEFRFLDHVRNTGVVGWSQDVLTPVWRRIGGNCHLNRRIGEELKESGAVRVTEVDRLSVGIWPIREFVRGAAEPMR